jgi:Na+-transporting NADH:ubiquinone oxidoreductase subunit NqrD
MTLALSFAVGALIAACLVYRRALAVARHQVDEETRAAAWADGYGTGHAIGIVAGRAQYEREIALARLGVEAKRRPLTDAEAVERLIAETRRVA